MSITASSAPNMSSVRWARFTRGSRKAGTPLAMASTPVSAEHPAAKALSTRTSPTLSLMCAGTSLPTVASG